MCKAINERRNYILHGSLLKTGTVSPCGCSKRGADKAVGLKKPQAYPLGYVEDFFGLRTKLEPFFSIRYREISRSMSFHSANTIIPTSKNKPTCWAISRCRSPNGLRKMP